MNITVNETQPSRCLSQGNLIEKIAKTFAYSLIIVVSLLGNCFIGIIVFKMKTMRKTINFLIVNMAMSDLAFPTFAIPWVIAELHVDSWHFSHTSANVLCRLIFFLPSASASVSIQSLVLIAVDRFGAVVCPLRSPLISSKCCPFFILATWIVPVVVYFPGLNDFKLAEYEGKWMCGQEGNVSFGLASTHVIYSLALCIILFYVPFILIIILYSIILLKLKLQKIPGGQTGNAHEKRMKRHRNVQKMVIAIVFGFALCWSPFNAILIGRWFFGTRLSCFYSFVALFMAHANCAINPCVCFIFSGNYRQGLRSICRANL